MVNDVVLAQNVDHADSGFSCLPLYMAGTLSMCNVGSAQALTASSPTHPWSPSLPGSGVPLPYELSSPDATTQPQPKRALAFKLLPRKKARHDAMAEEEGEFDKKEGSNHAMNDLVSEKQDTTVKTKGEFDDEECEYNTVTWLDRFLAGEFDEAFKPRLQAMLLDEW